MIESFASAAELAYPESILAAIPKPGTKRRKQGKYGIGFGKAWIKSPSYDGGAWPGLKYSRDLMMAILWGDELLGRGDECPRGLAR